MVTRKRNETVSIPDEPFRLEEANLPTKLARSLAGQTVTVQILPEEEAGTRHIKPRSSEDAFWMDPEGNIWNAYKPMRVLFTDPDKGKAWQFPRRWFRPAVSEPALDSP